MPWLFKKKRTIALRSHVVPAPRDYSSPKAGEEKSPYSRALVWSTLGRTFGRTSTSLYLRVKPTSVGTCLTKLRASSCQRNRRRGVVRSGSDAKKSADRLANLEHVVWARAFEKRRRQCPTSKSARSDNRALKSSEEWSCLHSEPAHARKRLYLFIGSADITTLCC